MYVNLSHAWFLNYRLYGNRPYEDSPPSQSPAAVERERDERAEAERVAEAAAAVASTLEREDEEVRALQSAIRASLEDQQSTYI